MSPLLLVGIILVASSALADVKHVLEQADPLNIHEINNLAQHQQQTKNAFQTGNPNDFWWMANDSPLKEAYDHYKKCSLKGNCSPEVQAQLNSFADSTASQFGPINIKKNPFLNGAFQSSKKSFQQGQFVTADLAGECGSNGYVCVQKELCVNGVIAKNDQLKALSNAKQCNNEEICCRLPNSFNEISNTASSINSLSDISIGKSSVGSTFKFTGGAGLSPGQIQVLPDDSDIKVYLVGESGSHNGISTNKPARDVSQDALFGSSTVDYSNVNFDSDVRFASTIRGPAYLPPIGSPAPPSEAPGAYNPPISSYQPSIPTTTSRPYSPTTPAYRPSPSIQTTTSRPYSPTTTSRPYTPSVPAYRPSTAYVPVSTTQTPINTPSINNNYYPSRPSPSPSTQRPFQSTTGESREYLPPFTGSPSTSPSRPTFSPTTQNPTGGYTYNSNPTPPFTYTPTGTPTNVVTDQVYVPRPRPTPPPTYLPPREPNDAGSSNTGVVIRPDQTTSEDRQRETQVPVGCAAALKCVQEDFCTADGFVSTVAVVLTKEQELARVPTTECRVEETGAIGKCCRDPNYKDPWPSANLVNGVDDGQYKEDPNLGQYSPDVQRQVRSDNVVPAASNLATRSIAVNAFRQNIDQPQTTGATCGERHSQTTPIGPGPIDANFAEFPWQAMILRDTNRSLLCGGAIIRRDAVLTAAHCVEGLQTNDILIKGGEWKLGVDDEPLPFQIVKVKAIIRHPEYKAGALVNDLAVLVLEEKLRPSKNIGTICLPEPNQIPTQGCVATGWGKRILQLHAKNALMHKIDVQIMDNQQCQQTLTEKFQHAVQNYSPNTLCGYSNVDQCKVDIGSALACSNGSGVYTLSGIFAWDTGCKQEGQIGGYIAPDVEWIETTLSKPLKQLIQIDREYNSLNSRN